MLLPHQRLSVADAREGAQLPAGVRRMLQSIEYARRKALEAREKASECIDNRTRAEWEKAAHMWEQLAAQYELLRGIGETT